MASSTSESLTSACAFLFLTRKVSLCNGNDCSSAVSADRPVLENNSQYQWSGTPQ